MDKRMKYIVKDRVYEADNAEEAVKMSKGGDKKKEKTSKVVKIAPKAINKN